MSEYTQSDILRQLRSRLSRHMTGRPGEYDPRWQEELDDVVSQILSREDFTYDPNTDPQFQYFQDRYLGLGKNAMLDTLGQAAKLTGGYGNSQGQLAAQQAYQSQLQGLYDRMPELYNLALERYRLRGDELMERYDMLSGLDSADYSRYSDRYDRWQEGRDYLTDRVDARQDFDYTAHRDAVKDDQWQQEFDEDLRRFNFKNKLGEFAPSPASGGSSGGRGRGGREEEDSITKQEKRRSLSKGGLRMQKTGGGEA